MTKPTFDDLSDDEMNKFIERAITHLVSHNFIPFIDDDYLSTKYANAIMNKAKELWADEQLGD